MSDNRSGPSTVADERDALIGFLDFHRQTLAVKCDGLSDEQLRQRAASPSQLSLLGLVQHLAAVERSWFTHVLNGEAAAQLWGRVPGGGRAEFDATDTDPRLALEVWHRECARSREIVAGIDSLDTIGYDGEDPYSLRHILLHMIAEYARHNGHADIIREHIDGTTGV